MENKKRLLIGIVRSGQQALARTSELVPLTLALVPSFASELSSVMGGD